MMVKLGRIFQYHGAFRSAYYDISKDVRGLSVSKRKSKSAIRKRKAFKAKLKSLLLRVRPTFFSLIHPSP